jgi:hypothetical protein
VPIQRWHFSHDGRRSNVYLTFYFSSVVLVSLLVGWDVILVCWGVCQFFHWLPHLHRGCWGLYGVRDLVQTREHLLWFWGFLIMILYSESVHKWQYGACPLPPGYLRLQIRTRVVQHSLLFHCNNCCTNMPQCYATRTLPDLFGFNNFSRQIACKWGHQCNWGYQWKNWQTPQQTSITSQPTSGDTNTTDEK